MGHCCPKPSSFDKIDSTCPLGTRLTKFSCDDVEKLLNETENTKWNPNACQSQTGSYCIKWAMQSVKFNYDGNERHTVKSVFFFLFFSKIFKIATISQKIQIGLLSPALRLSSQILLY